MHRLGSQRICTKYFYNVSHEREVIYMLNFYNYYDKIHPELIKKLKKMEEKTSENTGNNDILVIMGKNASKLDEERVKNGEESKYFKGKRILYDETAWNESEDGVIKNNTLNISDSEREYIIKNVIKIIVYHRNSFHHMVFLKSGSDEYGHTFITPVDHMQIHAHDNKNYIDMGRPV